MNFSTSTLDFSILPYQEGVNPPVTKPNPAFLEDIGEQNNLASKNKTKVMQLSRLLGDQLKKSQAQMPRLKDGGTVVPYP